MAALLRRVANLQYIASILFKTPDYSFFKKNIYFFRELDFGQLIA